ncbi:MAG: PAS domain S-box protein [Candidatus Magasanikbacteria bacterium]|jgi:PAS domain S-box-containing protein|nr:PAS domain S-box protein [Candidatus Magasanikbacteria bacterium]
MEPQPKGIYTKIFFGHVLAMLMLVPILLFYVFGVESAQRGISPPSFLSVTLIYIVTSSAIFYSISRYISEAIEKHSKTLATKLSEETKRNEELELARTTMTELVDDLQKKSILGEKEQSKNEAILSSIGDGLIATDQDGNILFMNTIAEDLLGYSSHEMIGKPVVEAVTVKKEDGKDIPVYERPTVKALATGERIKTSIAHCFYYQPKKGEMFPVSITVTPYVLGKKIVGSVIVFRNIVQEKEIDQAKTEFVSLASHQLRTPLTNINWYVEMILSGDTGKLTKLQKEYTEQIYESNQHMNDLVNALLNVSRIELGTFSVELSDVDLPKLSKSVISELTAKIKEKKLKLKTHFEKEVPIMQADSNLLRIVFQNLTSNAVKYTPEKGSVDISVTMKPLGKKKAKKNHVYITFKDTGYGIPKKEQSKIFSKLFRADNAKSMDVEGNGLGLYIVKSIVENSGGTIYFESEENKGTTFFIALPLDGMKPKEGTRKLK